MLQVEAAQPAIAAEAVQEFQTSLRGPLLRPDEGDYEEARRVWNGLIDRRPALIVRCTGVADVIEGVNFARQHHLPLAIHGGGHNAAGNATCDGGLMLDLSPLKGIHVDPKARTARAQGGATWGDLDRETQLFGLAAPGGVVSTTGIAGLTLGGGYGWLRRKHGLSCDNLISVDMVTADGRLLTASETENEDLFWAIRGGGGNFGVVTSFEYRLHPVGPQVTFLGTMYPTEKAGELLPRWRDFMATAPDEFTSQALFWAIPAVPFLPPETHGRRIFAVVGVYLGPVDEGERFIHPLRNLAEPVLDMSGQMPFTAVQTTFDWIFPKGELNHYWKSLHLNHVDSEVIETLLEWVVKRPSERSLVDIWAMGGAVSRVPAGATAIGDRAAPFTLVFNTTWEDPSDTDRNVTWTRDFYQAMLPYSPGSSYLNFPGFGEEENLVKKAYGKNYERLAAIKKKYDPTNLFRLNQNIKPAS
jgi:FAD/FMN-containing dehydrogenase